MDRTGEQAPVSSEVARKVFARAVELEGPDGGALSRESVRQAAAEAGLSEEAVALALAEVAASEVATPSNVSAEDVIVVQRAD